MMPWPSPELSTTTPTTFPFFLMRRIAVAGLDETFIIVLPPPVLIHTNLLFTDDAVGFAQSIGHVPHHVLVILDAPQSRDQPSRNVHRREHTAGIGESVGEEAGITVVASDRSGIVDALSDSGGCERNVE